MSRLRRVEGHSRFFFITSNLGRGLPQFSPDEFAILAGGLNDQRIRGHCELCAYCLMPDHIHAIVFPHETTTISALLHRFKLSASHSIQSRRLVEDPLWQSRLQSDSDRSLKIVGRVFQNCAVLLPDPRLRAFGSTHKGYN